MPSNQHQRKDSWPPTVLYLSAEHEDKESDLATLRPHESSRRTDVEQDQNLDENPFSYFLSSPEDSDDDDEDLSAGIENSDSRSVGPITCTVSPSDFQRRNIEEPLSPVSSEEDYIYNPYDAEIFDIGVAVPLTLREFSASHCHIKSRQLPVQTQSFTKLSGPKPGLVRARSPSQHSVGSSRLLHAHSYPVRKPRSWRRPSNNVWTIPEESFSSNSSKESLEPKNRKVSSETKSSPSLTLAAPKIPYFAAFVSQEDFQDRLTPPPRLTATLEGEDPTQISVWERNFENQASGQKFYSALGSPKSPVSQEGQERSSAAARVTELKEVPFPPEPVLILPLRRKKTVRFALPVL